MAEIKARPTVYNGIQMRSRLEADYAAHLDSLDLPWLYEPTCFGSQDGQWLPDFQTSGGDRLPGQVSTYVELKSAHLFAQRSDERFADVIARIDRILAKMTIAWQTEPDAMLELIFWKWGTDEPAWEIYAYGDEGMWQVLGPELPFPLAWPGMGRLSSSSDGGN